MKQYIVSEEELKKLYMLGFYDGDEGNLHDDEYKDFLKSKQPVELVAEGEVMFHSSDCFYSIGTGISIIYTMYTNILEKFAKVLGKNIKIFIQEVNNDK